MVIKLENLSSAKPVTKECLKSCSVGIQQIISIWNCHRNSFPRVTVASMDQDEDQIGQDRLLKP